MSVRITKSLKLEYDSCILLSLTCLVGEEVLVHFKGALNRTVLVDLCPDVVQHTRDRVSRGSIVLVLFVVNIIATLTSSFALGCALLLATGVVLTCRG